MSDGDTPDHPASPPVPVPTESITKAPVDVPSTGTLGQAELEYEALTRAHEQTQFQRELGLLGKLFGGKSEKPGNISATVIVLSFAVLATVWSVDTYIAVVGKHVEPLMPFERIFSGLMSLVSLVLGYIFGSHDNDSK